MFTITCSDSLYNLSQPDLKTQNSKDFIYIRGGGVSQKVTNSPPSNTSGEVVTFCLLTKMGVGGGNT